MALSVARLVPLIALVVAAAVGSGACNRGDSPTIDVPTTTTAAPVGSTTSTAPAAAVTSTSGVVRPVAPEQAATGLFDAWKAKDKQRAGRFASARAIEQLFGSGGGAEGLEFMGCEPEGAQFSCAWRYEGGGLIMTVENAPGGGYLVELVRFIAD